MTCAAARQPLKVPVRVSVMILFHSSGRSSSRRHPVEDAGAVDHDAQAAGGFDHLVDESADTLVTVHIDRLKMERLRRRQLGIRLPKALLGMSRARPCPPSTKARVMPRPTPEPAPATTLGCPWLLTLGTHAER